MICQLAFKQLNPEPYFISMWCGSDGEGFFN